MIVYLINELILFCFLTTLHFRISAVAFNENDYETLQEIQTQIGCNSMACPTFMLGSFSDCPLQEAGVINLDLKDAIECNEQGFIVKLAYHVDYQLSGVFPNSITSNNEICFVDLKMFFKKKIIIIFFFLSRIASINSIFS